MGAGVVESYTDELDGLGSILGRNQRFLSTTQRPDRLWGPFSVQSKRYRGFLSGGKGTGA
jgi:hypothetical protein